MTDRSTCPASDRSSACHDRAHGVARALVSGLLAVEGIVCCVKALSVSRFAGWATGAWYRLLSRAGSSRALGEGAVRRSGS